jgi:hypothetical protein
MPARIQSTVHQSSRATPAQSSAVDLAAEIEALSGLDRHDLRVRWRKLLRTTPPDHLSRSLLLRILVYRIQARIHGDVDRETARTLDRIARDSARRRAAGQGRKAPQVPPAPLDRGLKPGTLLVREHEGQVHTVTVMANGFAWDGTTYKSLSEIARAITGTRWNGPRFFGLRDRATPSHAGQAAKR